MSAGLDPTESLDAVTVLAAARTAAFNLDPDACALVDVLRLCYGTELAERRALTVACALLLRQRQDDAQWRLDEPWPLPSAVLWHALVGLLGADLRDARALMPPPWDRFRALHNRNTWLASAAKLETRDGHLMRRAGGLRLPAATFNGERLRAQVVAVSPSPGVPGGDVLRLTWEKSARLVAQSRPGRFAELDPTAEPE